MTDLMNSPSPDIGVVDPRTINAIVELDRALHDPDPARVRVYRDYVAGRHRILLTDQQKEILRNLLSNRFCDNVMHPIVAEARNRLSFRRWTCDDDDVRDALSELYIKAKVSSRQGRVHYSALRDGNTTVGLSWDNKSKRVILHRERWWDGTTGIFVAYDTDDEMSYAVKEWPTAAGWYRTIWLPGAIYRFQSADGHGWQPLQLPDDPAWPVPWLKLDGTPLHPPVVHFPNSVKDEGSWGESEIGGGACGFQDQINDLHWTLSANALLTGFQMIGISGIVLPIDPVSKKPKQPTVGPGQILTSPKPDTKFQVLPAGSPDGILKTLEQKKSDLASSTATPRHVITGGDYPSGEALLRAERPAVEKANQHVAEFSTRWAEVGHRAVELMNRFGGAGLDEDALVEADFDETSRQDLLSKSVIVANVVNQVSNQEALRILGYSEEQIDQIMEERADEAKTSIQNAQSTFNAGTGPGTQMPGSGPATQQPNGPRPGQPGPGEPQPGKPPTGGPTPNQPPPGEPVPGKTK
jgi:hypothetical protein